jgi:hypothetical protein
MAKSTSKAAKAARARRAEEKAAKLAAAGAGTSAAPDKAAKAAKVSKSDQPFKVRATQPGYYDNVTRREGDVFMCANEQAFSSKWMERVSPRTPEKVTTGQEELNRKHDELLSDKLERKGATGGANPLGAD